MGSCLDGILSRLHNRPGGGLWRCYVVCIQGGVWVNTNAVLRTANNYRPPFVQEKFI